LTVCFVEDQPAAVGRLRKFRKLQYLRYNMITRLYKRNSGARLKMALVDFAPSYALRTKCVVFTAKY